jgi:hypothetical protein
MILKGERVVSEQSRLDVEAERLGGLEIDHQLELGGELDWQIARRNAVQDFRALQTCGAQCHLAK